MWKVLKQMEKSKAETHQTIENNCHILDVLQAFPNAKNVD